MDPFVPDVIIEPFRIRSVEPIRFIDPEARRRALEEAGWNPFRLHADDVLIDLLTDSGTGAMSSRQWAGMISSDESYAGSPSFYRFEAAVRDITGFHHVVPTHQGRAAEHILCTLMAKPGDVVLSNTLFDTTRAHVEHVGAEGRDLPCPEARDAHVRAPFKGNLDVEALDRSLTELGREKVPFVLLTVTNNSGGGQPVSLANAHAVSEVCRRHGVPLFIDACRFAENAWFVKTREAGQGERPTIEIARELFSLADGCTMSAKKDGMANIGGFLSLRDDELAARARNLEILTEGFPTYGGMAGYDLEAIAQGLYEALDENYLRYRIRSIEYLGEKLVAAGVPIIEPTGGHAVYLDAAEMLPGIAPLEYPAWALCNELYLAAGIRGVEIGSVMFGRQPDGSEKAAARELVRLAFPRRVYTQSHVDYVAGAIVHVHERRAELGGYRIVEESPVLRHFTARLEPLGIAAG